VFETVLQRCMNEGLVAGEGFAIDANVLEADAALARGTPGAPPDDRAFGSAQASRAVREYLEGIDAEGRPVFLSLIRRQNGRALREDRLSSPTQPIAWSTFGLA
jgi:hypothetical protein